MVAIKLNGTRRSIDADPQTPLLWALRDIVGLTGTKLGCDRAGFGEGNPAPPPVMASWDLSALKAAQQRSFVGASAVRQPRVMAGDPVGLEIMRVDDIKGPFAMQLDGGA